mmetsp:Transcript_27463/g.50678  ORF Transcript_27463/g.50678 Transcript_27463/m.50678 type:complete len:280 (-) Transcript_27463:1496-2335(-)
MNGFYFFSCKKAPVFPPGPFHFRTLRRLLCRRFFFLDLFAGFLIDDFHRQAHLAAVVKAQELDLDLLAFLQHVRRMVQAAVFDLGHVDQPVTLAKEVHEGTEVHDLHHCSGVNHAFFGLSHDRVDHVVGFLDRVAVGRCDLDDAVVVDVDFGTRHFDNLADHLTARADDLTDFIRGHLHGFNARRVDREVGRTCDGFAHFAQDVHPACFGLLQSLLHDLGRDACDLDVHLQRGDPVFGPSHLEVHVAEVIFITQDVRQDRVFAAFLKDQTHGHTGHSRF